MPPHNCSNCGKPLRPGDRFCQHCGFAVDAKSLSERQAGGPEPDQVEEGLTKDSPRRSNAGALIVIGIGVLLIAAAIGFAALSSAAPTLVAPPATMPPAATRALAALEPGPPVLQDQLVYFPTASATLTAATAKPKDPNETFLVVPLGLASNTNLYPEDLDWTMRAPSQEEYRSVGFGIPLKYDTEEPTPVVFSIIGRLLHGPLLVTSQSDSAVIGLVFVVPKTWLGGTLVSPQKQTWTFGAPWVSMSMDVSQVGIVKFDSSMIEQLTGSESWIVTP